MILQTRTACAARKATATASMKNLCWIRIAKHLARRLYFCRYELGIGSGDWQVEVSD